MGPNRTVFFHWITTPLEIRVVDINPRLPMPFARSRANPFYCRKEACHA